MRVLLLTLSLLVALPQAASAVVGDTAAAAIRQVVEAQLAAFRRDDGAAAFAFASPMIQDMFRTPEGFMAMVRQGYAPVYRPQVVEFQDIVAFRGQPTQRVYVVGPAGRGYIAHYLMERQPDGTWRIDGCILEPLPDTAV